MNAAGGTDQVSRVGLNSTDIDAVELVCRARCRPEHLTCGLKCKVGGVGQDIIRLQCYRSSLYTDSLHSPDTFFFLRGLCIFVFCLFLYLSNKK